MRLVHASEEGGPAIDSPTRRTMLRVGLGLSAALVFSDGAFAKVLVKDPKVLVKTHKSLVKKTSRELSLLNLHTGERLKAEYVQNGRYVPSALHAVSVLLRDHYNNRVHPIDPQLLDLAYNVHRKVGGAAQFHVVCGYRSPETNAMMHEESAGVAAHSMHIEGKAIDLRLPGTRLASLKRSALALKAGGVGYYPEDDFVHIDTGAIRHWAG
jgi:uncharacterized protein YcbK (DUF882 family)